MSADDEEPEDYWPWEAVRAALDPSQRGQARPQQEGRDRFGAAARACPRCGTPGLELTWIYMSDPAWQPTGGQEGWLTVCKPCGLQVDYLEAPAS